VDIKNESTMKEKLELRVNLDHAGLLFRKNEGRNIGTTVKIVELSKDDPRFFQIPLIDVQVQKKYKVRFFFGWEIKRIYTKKELDAATLFHLKIKTTFEPAGEECGTLYDETKACEICGSNRSQKSPLTLKSESIPNKDIARTIAGEIVVSEKFVSAYKIRTLKGAIFRPISFEKRRSAYYQLIASHEIGLSQNTVVGINPFDLSTNSKGEIYKCPKGHTLGLNLLSEPYVLKSQIINESDFFSSTQKIGVKRGLLRPEPIYFCSPAFRKMVKEERLSGFEFEITNLHENNII